jgi:O-antigen/teichoic acid export membrane protein
LLYSRTVKLLLLIVFPLILVTVTLANDGLRLWLGAEFAVHSTRVLQWLAVGVFINCLSAAPFAVVQGVGRPDLTAKLHLLELPVYLAALFYLIKIRGIEGAAIAWTGRVAIDAVVLFILAQHLLPVRSATKIQTPLVAAATLATFALALIPGSLLYRGAFIALALPVFALVTWFLVLSPEERHFVKEVPVRL